MMEIFPEKHLNSYFYNNFDLHFTIYLIESTVIAPYVYLNFNIVIFIVAKKCIYLTFNDFFMMTVKEDKNNNGSNFLKTTSLANLCQRRLQNII